MPESEIKFRSPHAREVHAPRPTYPNLAHGRVGQTDMFTPRPENKKDQANNSGPEIPKPEQASE